jgi:CRISPR-associated exonuclease Cas4
MNNTIFPLAYLNAWEYCPRRFYLEYQLGETADNEHIILGRHLHRNVDQEGQSQEGDTLVYRQQWVWSDRLLVNGIIDAVEERDRSTCPSGIQKGSNGSSSQRPFSTLWSGFVLEERTGRTITSGEIFYYANRRRQKVPFTPQLRHATEQAIQAAHAAVMNSMPAPIDHPENVGTVACRAFVFLEK